MNFSEYKDADDFLKRNNLTPQEGLRIIDEEIKKILKANEGKNNDGQK